MKKSHPIGRFLKAQGKKEKKSWLYKWTFHKVSYKTILTFQADEQNEVGQHRQKITRCGKHTDYGGLTLLFQVRIISFRPQNLLAWKSWGYILCMFIISYALNMSDWSRNYFLRYHNWIWNSLSLKGHSSIFNLIALRAPALDLGADLYV